METVTLPDHAPVPTHYAGPVLIDTVVLGKTGNSAIHSIPREHNFFNAFGY